MAPHVGRKNSPVDRPPVRQRRSGSPPSSQTVPPGPSKQVKTGSSQVPQADKQGQGIAQRIYDQAPPKNSEGLTHGEWKAYNQANQGSYPNGQVPPNNKQLENLDTFRRVAGLDGNASYLSQEELAYGMQTGVNFNDIPKNTQPSVTGGVNHMA